MTDRPRYPKSSCCVPFCERATTTRPPEGEWLCRDHWQLVDRYWKQVRTREVRRMKARGWYDDPAYEPVINGFLDEIWRRMRSQAIERATGVSA